VNTLLVTLAIGACFLVLFAALVLIFYYLKRGFLTIQNQILSSIVPRHIRIEPSAQDLIDLAIELWRLEKRINKTVDKVSEDESKAFQNSIIKLQRYLQKNDIEVTDYTGQNFNEGMNLDILSMEKDPTLKQNIIFETHEPAVIHKGILIKKARVVVHEK
jgi:molecular chaperone GrpE (heat shock protein)